MHKLGKYLGMAVLTGGLLLGGLALVPDERANAAPTTTSSNPPNANTPHTPRQAGTGQSYEHHPAIHHALKQLHVVKAELEKDPHDFDGHRVQAIHDVERAIAELKEALQSARK